ncbi:hypothetical protein ACWDRR_08810, partial [Kitasatospora sp. NPDC003701]
MVTAMVAGATVAVGVGVDVAVPVGAGAVEAGGADGGAAPTVAGNQTVRAGGILRELFTADVDLIGT